MLQRLSGLLLLLLAGHAAAAGGVFKWVDARGVTHYDDQSLLAERMTRATIARGSVAADPTATVSPEYVRQVADQCADLRLRSASFREARELYGRDPAGNQYRLSENQIALERAQLAQETTRYCRPLAAQALLAEARAEALRQRALKAAQ